MNTPHTRVQADPSGELELVRTAKRGDFDAFEELVQRYSGVVFRVALHISRCHEDAEEIAQETFLKAFRHLSSFEERARFSTWLTRIAVNAALVKMRGLRPTETVTIGEEPERDESVPQQVADWRPNPEQLYSRKELSGMLRGALDSLPSGYSEVFWLRDVEGFTIAETAEMLGISVPAVKTRLLRARPAVTRTPKPALSWGRKYNQHREEFRFGRIVGNGHLVQHPTGRVAPALFIFGYGQKVEKEKQPDLPYFLQKSGSI